MRAGVNGVNLHVRAYAINAPFSVTRKGLEPRPLLYGLMMFARTLGPDARLVRLHLSAPRSLNLSAWAVRVRGGQLHVLVIDKSGRSARVELHLARHRARDRPATARPGGAVAIGGHARRSAARPRRPLDGDAADRDDHPQRARI